MRTIKKKNSSKKTIKAIRRPIYPKKEDVVEIMLVAKKFADHVNKIEEKLEIEISRLQKEIDELKKNH